ncbi:claudin-15-like isoform X1 [Strigops habroptila]|uniref:Claudin n=1 Tax=Strigops habroptila TaxID=2489341 RepID=A0A672UM23_STRHB|nr:claudin-15-like isoform X1 [Strigops habroptila]
MTPALGWGVTLGLALGAVGWGLLVASLPHSVWGMAGGQATAVASVAITRGLWNDCATDASGVTSCVPLVSLITLPGYLQGSRLLAVLAALLGVPGLALGGGSGARRSARAAGGALLLLAGLCSLAAAGWFAAATSQEFFDPQHNGVRFEPGPGVLLAGGGGAMAAVGGAVVMAAARGPPRSRSAPPPAASLGDKYVRNAYV